MSYRTIRSIELAIFLSKQNKWEYRTITKLLYSEWQQSAGISPGARRRVRGGRWFTSAVTRGRGWG